MTINTSVKADFNAPPITRLLSEFINQTPSKSWDSEVDHQTHRTFANWVGCAIGASHHPTVETAIRGVSELNTCPQASIFGRTEKVDIVHAALINGISSHTFDFDDTHLRTIIHPAGPVASAGYAVSEWNKNTGRELIDAITIGVEVSCRIGNAIYPEHYDRGWHITGSTGMLGASAVCARLLKLNIEQTQMALGIAASQPIGLREQFGTMTKPFHPGGAAQVGVMSALLAKNGFTSSPQALEAPRGLLQVFSDKHNWNEITENLGKTWEIALNTYKPFACGIVIHPSIDGCIQLRNEHHLSAENIREINLKVHSLVLELTGKMSPKTGLEGKFSVYHSCAVGLIYGKAGEEEYSDHVVNDPAVIQLRKKIKATIDNSISEASADIRIETIDGKLHHIFIKDAIGSLKNPMSDFQLKSKFIDQSTPIIGSDKAEETWQWAITLGHSG